MTSLRFCASPFLDFRARWALDTTTAWPELMFSLSSPQEERAGEKRPLLLNAPLPVPTAIELRSADFSPPRSGPAKTAGSGLKCALLSCRNSLNSMAVLPVPLPTRASRGEGENFWWLCQAAPAATHRTRQSLPNSVFRRRLTRQSRETSWFVLALCDRLAA